MTIQSLNMSEYEAGNTVIQINKMARVKIYKNYFHLLFRIFKAITNKNFMSYYSRCIIETAANSDYHKLRILTYKKDSIAVQYKHSNYGK